MRNSPYLDRPLRTEAEASRQLSQNRPSKPANPPVHSSHARYLRELDRIRNAGREVPHA